jgi:phosphoribosylformimino-5-aminoimidazole carboxamide ribotide isomerase
MDLKGGRVAYGGWLETSDEAIDTFLKPMLKRGLNRILCTDISRDGTLTGPNIELYRALQADFPDADFIASGGVATRDDLVDLAGAGLFGVVVGRAYYEDRITMEEMAAFNT